MSFIQDTVQCVDCKYQMNVAFGVQGVIVTDQWPADCPKCHGKIEKISAGWNAKNEKPHSIDVNGYCNKGCC